MANYPSITISTLIENMKTDFSVFCKHRNFGTVAISIVSTNIFY
jgi:hypothetical protein